ncbi:hypothetical protein MHA_2669 [Mannheimia haemolytica PHL213]|nr:hypothetical protein MHA_2669 [Mannheimia haemolytica PHL213]
MLTFYYFYKRLNLVINLHQNDRLFFDVKEIELWNN